MLTLLAASIFLITSRTAFGKYPKDIGQYPLAILEAEYALEKDVLFIELAAKNALLHSHGVLESRGGLFNLDCGEYQTYALWQSKEKDCTPYGTVSENLGLMLQKNLQKQLAATEFSELQDAYVFTWTDDSLSGSAFKPLKKKILNDKSSITIMPSFISFSAYRSFPYDPFFDWYRQQGITEKILACEAEKKDLEECAKQVIQAIDKSRFSTVIDCDRKVQEKMQKTRMLPLCITSMTEKAIRYDEGKISEKNPTLRFALYLSDLPPSAVTDLAAEAKQGSDKAVILSWEGSSEADISKYMLYYSAEPFHEGDKIWGSGEIREIVLDPASAKQVGSINLSCTYKSIHEPCTNAIKYGEEEMEERLLPGTMYRDAGGKFYYILEGLKATPYTFSVIATDLAGNAIAAFPSPALFTPVDLLAPGAVDFSASLADGQVEVLINRITYNADGSEYSNDAKWHYIFVSNTAEGIISFEALAAREASARILLPVPLSTQDPLFVAVIAADTAGPIELQELSATERALKVHEAYEPLLSSLGRTVQILP